MFIGRSFVSSRSCAYLSYIAWIVACWQSVENSGSSCIATIREVLDVALGWLGSTWFSSLKESRCRSMLNDGHPGFRVGTMWGVFDQPINLDCIDTSTGTSPFVPGSSGSIPSNLLAVSTVVTMEELSVRENIATIKTVCAAADNACGGCITIRRGLNCKSSTSIE